MSPCEHAFHAGVGLGNAQLELGTTFLSDGYQVGGLMAAARTVRRSPGFVEVVRRRGVEIRAVSFMEDDRVGSREREGDDALDDEDELLAQGDW